MNIGLWVHCFYPDHFYGTETYTKQVAKNLLDMGHNVTVISAIFQGEPSADKLLTRYEYDGIPVVCLDKNYVPHTSVAETYWQETMRPHIRHLLEQERFDVIHVTHLVNHTAVLLEEVKRFDRPLIATLTDFFGFCHNAKLEAFDGSLCAGPDPLRINCIACYRKQARLAVEELSSSVNPVGGSWLLRLDALRERAAYALGSGDDLTGDLIRRPHMLQRAYKLYDAMIAPTSFLYKAYAANGFERDKLVINRFGVDLDRSPKAIRQLKHRLTIGFIGQLAPHKGLHLLLSALRALENQNVRLIVYGSASSDSYMEELKQIAGPETEFRGTFPPSMMASVLAEMDLLAIPSTWYENSPLVLLDALASHTPVIVSNVEGLTEFITEGVNGWSFRRGDVDDLTRLLRELVQAPEQVYLASGSTDYSRTTKMMTDEILKVYERFS